MRPIPSRNKCYHFRWSAIRERNHLKGSRRPPRRKGTDWRAARKLPRFSHFTLAMNWTRGKSSRLTRTTLLSSFEAAYQMDPFVELLAQCRSELCELLDDFSVPPPHGQASPGSGAAKSGFALDVWRTTLARKHPAVSLSPYKRRVEPRSGGGGRAGRRTDFRTKTCRERKAVNSSIETVSSIQSLRKSDPEELHAANSNDLSLSVSNHKKS